MTLKELRLCAGLTQEQVAKLIDVDQTAVSNWERKKNRPKPKYLKKLANLYGCTVLDLLRKET